MIFLIDTQTWIDYFVGTKQGTIIQKLLRNEANKIITVECCLSEIKGYCLKNSIDFNRLYEIIKRSSLILPVLREHWLNASKIRYEIRKTIKNFGLIDAILIAKQQEFNCKIVTGDHHFKNLKNILFIA